MEENRPTKDEHDPDPDSDFASIVETETNKRKRTAKHKANDPDRKKSYRRSWRSASPLTKLTIYLTGIIAVATALYMGFTGWQLHEIRSGGEETRKIAQAARDSADAAQRQTNIAAEQLQAVRDSAQAAKHSANAASTAVEQNKELIKAAQVQANTSQVAARAAEETARIAAQSLRVGERAYVTIKHIEMPELTIGPIPNITVTLFNGGRTPASGFQFSRWIYLRTETSLNRFIVDPIRKRINTYGSEIMPAGSEKKVVFTRTLNIKEKDLAAIIESVDTLHFDLAVEYSDSFGKSHFFRLCSTYNPADGEFYESECKGTKPN